MKQSIYSILYVLLLFTSSALLAATWQGTEDSRVPSKPVSNQAQVTSPEDHLRALEQAVWKSYNTYVANAPEAEEVGALQYCA